jgi:beta-N-acetylhexosaminidase
LKAVPKGTNLPRGAYDSVEATQNRIVLLIFTDDARSDAGRTLDQQLRQRIPDANVIYIDPRDAAGMTEPVMSAVRQAQSVIAAVFAVPVAGRVVRNATGAMTSQAALQEGTALLLQNVVQAAADKTVVLAMGNPYIAQQLPEMRTYICTFSNVNDSELSAVKAMFGEIPMPGHLPVTIPNVANRGMGLGAPMKSPSGGLQ